jgi:hypothetical protein
MDDFRPINDRNYNVYGRLRQRKQPYTNGYDHRKHQPGYKKLNRSAKLIEYNLISKAYDQMCVLNQSDQWSSTLNCQTFTRCCCVEYFKFDFPEDIRMISDVMTTMVNLYIDV